MKSVNGIDWLSFSAYLAEGVETIAGTNFFLVKKEDYGTRNFSEVYRISTTIRDERNRVKEKLIPFATLCAKPQSKILNERLVTFKLDNAILYTEYWFTYLLLFLDEFHLQFPKISRVDIFRDFQAMPYDGENVSPYKFLRDIASIRIVKKGGAKFQLFADVKDGGVYAVTYGSILSGRQLQIYNKSKELREVKDKPYIRYMWDKAGFDKNTPTFRAEIRIQKRGLDLLDLETEERSQLSLQHFYEYKVQPILDNYLSKVAVWKDARGEEIRPFVTIQSDEILFPFIPKFVKYADNPNPEKRAKSVLRWAESAKADVEGNVYLSKWHWKTIAILKDFIWLLQNTIPDTHGICTPRWCDMEYSKWVSRRTDTIKNYVRQHQPDYLPGERVKHTDDLFTSYPD